MTSAIMAFSSNMRTLVGVLLGLLLSYSTSGIWEAYQHPQAHSNQSSTSSNQEFTYKTHLFSRDPLVIYVESFVSLDEASHFISVTKDHFKPSLETDDQGTESRSSGRTSQSAVAPRDSISRRIEQRALSFQGYLLDSQLEALQVVYYGLNNEFKHHTDWFQASQPKSDDLGGNRDTTFFVYLQDNCTGGGTHFPFLKVPGTDLHTTSSGGEIKSAWCRFIECSKDNIPEHGVVFKPIAGNAIFWGNLHINGTGRYDTVHAGLPVASGQKIGLNIWTRQRRILRYEQMEKDSKAAIVA